MSDGAFSASKKKAAWAQAFRQLLQLQLQLISCLIASTNIIGWSDLSALVSKSLSESACHKLETYLSFDGAKKLFPNCNNAVEASQARRSRRLQQHISTAHEGQQETNLRDQTSSIHNLLCVLSLSRNTNTLGSCVIIIRVHLSVPLG